MSSLRKYMSVATRNEVNEIDKRIKKRAQKAFRRDAGELAVSDDSSDEFLTVYPKNESIMFDD